MDHKLQILNRKIQVVFSDSHTHLYAEEFNDDRGSVIGRAMESGVNHLFLPAIDSEYHERMLKLVGLFPGRCFPMMGLHPTSVKENFREELSIVSDYLSNPAFEFYAIGEAGIDLYWDKTFEAQQIIAFDYQLDLAVKYDLPVVIHTRNSMELALGILERRNDPRIRGVFHCFSGNTGNANQAIKLGFMLGIGGVITYKNSGLQAVVENVDLEHLVLETDAPWLTPVPHRGKRNEPAYIPVIAQKIADLKNMTLEQVAETTTGNTARLFGIA